MVPLIVAVASGKTPKLNVRLNLGLKIERGDNPWETTVKSK